MPDDDIFEDIFSEADALNKVEGANTKKLSDSVRLLRSVEGQITDTEDHLKALKAEKQRLSTDIIPSMMNEMGVERLDVDGVTVAQKTIVSASIPADRKDEAFLWLRNEGLDAIIKNDVLLSFGKGQDNEAGNCVETLREHGFDPVTKTHVHPMTLKAFVKERVENGKPIDLDMFGAYINNIAEIRRK